MASTEKSFTERDLERFERARERAFNFGFYKYAPHYERIIEELKEIIKLDEEFTRKGG